MRYKANSASGVLILSRVLSLSSLNNQQSTSASSRPRRRNCRAAYIVGELLSAMRHDNQRGNEKKRDPPVAVNKSSHFSTHSLLFTCASVSSASPQRTIEK